MAFVAALCLTACGKPGSGDSGATTPDDAEQTPLVRVIEVERRTVRRTIDTSSYLESEHRVTVLSKVSGRVDEVMVDAGVGVEKDAVLLRLDDREARSRLTQAEVQLEDSKVRLALAKLESEASNHRVEQARIEQKKAVDTHKRNLESRGLIPERDIEDSGYALETAEQTLSVSQFDERKAKLEVTAASNTVAEMQAKLTEAQITLADHEVRAPLSGVVESLEVRGGEMIATSTELCVVVDTKRLVTYLLRPQRELGMLRDAKVVDFTTDAWPDRVFRAEIDLVSPVIDETNGSFKVRARIPREDAEVLRPGMFLRAQILTENQREALMVPKAAILGDGAESVAFVVRSGVAHRIVVDPGLEETDHLEVLPRGDDGIVEGDVVVISGHRNLRDQTAVDIVDND